MAFPFKILSCECDACSGTGLYVGFAEPKGHAVVCRGCGGTGKREMRYKEFQPGKRHRGVQHVINDGGIWFTRKPDSLKTITVGEFYRAKESNER